MDEIQQYAGDSETQALLGESKSTPESEENQQGPQITVQLCFGSKKKLRKFPSNFELKVFEGTIEQLFPSVKDQKWHAETSEGVWLEDEDDWGMLLSTSETSALKILELKIVVDKNDTGNGDEPPAAPAQSTQVAVLSQQPMGYYGSTPMMQVVAPMHYAPTHQGYALQTQPIAQQTQQYVQQPRLPPGSQPAQPQPSTQLQVAAVEPPPKSAHDQKMDFMWEEAVSILREKAEPMDVLFIRKCFPNERKPRAKDLNYLLYRELDKGTVAMQQAGDDKPKWNLVSDPFQGRPFNPAAAQLAHNQGQPFTSWGRQQDNNQLRLDRMWAEAQGILQAAGEPMDALFIRKKFTWPEPERPKVKELNFLLYRELNKGNLAQHNDGRRPKWSLA